MERRIIPFELRSEKDDDIAEALEKAITSENSRSSVIRAALRYYLLDKPPHFKSSIHLEDAPDIFEKVILDDKQLDSALDDLLNF
ncbi:ribbon-helix-helix protein, CopG family [Sporosarcina sp. FSL W7-1283]|uniref:ribbon-helix-helix protein, CopG family n=1 Tax=Sporosarcina sp. FSL W7-1283 TaxID=2921560 RepID=UPI0030FC6221